MNLKPDVEASFEFINFRKGNIFQDYRPAHLVMSGFLTTGVHNYYNLCENAEGKIEGTITFITPEEYPGCMWNGKKIEMYEGERLVGYATIKEIYNPILRRNG